MKTDTTATLAIRSYLRSIVPVQFDKFSGFLESFATDQQVQRVRGFKEVSGSAGESSLVVARTGKVHLQLIGLIDAPIHCLVSKHSPGSPRSW